MPRKYKRHSTSAQTKDRLEFVECLKEIHHLILTGDEPAVARIPTARQAIADEADKKIQLIQAMLNRMKAEIGNLREG